MNKKNILIGVILFVFHLTITLSLSDLDINLILLLVLNPLMGILTECIADIKISHAVQSFVMSLGLIFVGHYLSNADTRSRKTKVILVSLLVASVIFIGNAYLMAKSLNNLH